jgi:hypothetical protein
MSEFSDLQERMMEAAKQGKDLFLGRLTWYSFSNVRIDHGDAVRALVRAGIDTQLPLPPRDADVFRRVTGSKAGRKRVPTAMADVFENYRLVEVSKPNEELIIRRIVCQRVDQNNRELEHEDLDDLVFTHATSAVKMENTTGRSTSVSVEMAGAIMADYNLWRNHLNTYSVREWTRKFLIALRATSVRPGGGVYFVREEYADKVAAAEEFVNALPGDCVFHSLPLVDDRKQREMLQKAFEAETSDAIDNLLAEITDIRQNGIRIGEARYSEFLGEYQTLMAKTKEYEGLLEEKLANTHSRLSIFQSSIMGLLGNVRASSKK